MEDTNLHSYIFEEQYNSYMRDGYAMAPSGEHMVVNVNKEDDGTDCMTVGTIQICTTWRVFD